MFYKRALLAVLLLLTTGISAAPLSYYFDDLSQYQPTITSPESYLGQQLGQRHLRHDQLKSYLQHLAKQSKRIITTEIGKTYQQRDQFLLTISSPENLANLDNILKNRQAQNYKAGDEPLVIWLGYSIHGDEISGAHASLLVAYHLAASQSAEVKSILDNVIIVIEPSMNPDGMDRFSNWVNTFGNLTPNADPQHIEHYQGWPSGRTNHFWFDLNRDWLLLSQQESQNRLKYFHYYQPNVLGDFHEMGAHSSYFFQPGIPSRTNPLTPLKNTLLTAEIAKFHAKTFDANNRLYYSQESFDDFFYGKGSTYPDIHGAVGILFEQASSRGQQQSTINGLLTFSYGIKNHLLTSLSTIKGALANADKLKSYRQTFYQDAVTLAKKQSFDGYLINESKDKQRLNEFLSKLKQHQIKVYPLSQDYKHKGKTYLATNSYFVPLAQTQYRLIEAIFGTATNFKDNTFYDVSGWTLPYAMNIAFSKVKQSRSLKIGDKTWQQSSIILPDVDKTAYAYAIEWHHFYSPALLDKLLTNKVKVKVATKTFTSEIAGEDRAFSLGTLLIPAAIQQHPQWRNLLIDYANEYQIPVHSIGTGLTLAGSNLGSNAFRLIKPKKLMMLGGRGISQYEAGEVKFYLDSQLNMPVSIVEHDRINRINLEQYSHIILVDGQYSALSATTEKVIKQWVKQGGTIIAQKRAAKWLAEQEILSASFVSKANLDALFDTDKLSYKDKESLAGKKRIAGAIFEAKLDLSHPLAYGYSRELLPMFKNSTVIMDMPHKPFTAVAQYTEQPLLSGYTDSALVQRIAFNTPLMAHNFGKGKVIATSENLAFRGYWLGTAKLLANAIFFDRVFSAPAK